MNHAFRFGEWWVEPNTNRLSCDSATHQLEPLAMDVLVLLLGNPGEVVSTEQVLERVWSGRHGDPGMVKKRIAQIRQALGDDARHPGYIETIAKRGYRTVAPVLAIDPSNGPGPNGQANAAHGLPIRHAQPPTPDAAPASTAPVVAEMPAAEARFRGRRQAIVTVAALTLVTLIGGATIAYWYGADRPGIPRSDSQRLAVEPFTYPVSDPHLARYATLFQEGVTHHLSRLLERDFVVQSPDQADFVVRGSMSEVSGRVRLFVRVVKTDPGIVLWSKSLDLPREPTEALLATRPEQLATMVWWVAPMWNHAAGLTDSTQAVREHIAGGVETNELWQGMGGDWNAALAHFERASALDPEFVLPLMSLANLYVNRLGGRLRYQEAVGPAHAYARRVLEINPNTGTWLLGWINIHDLHYAAAQANLEYARQSGFPTTFIEFSLGLLSLAQGELDDAIERFNTALRIGARGNQAAAHVFIALAYFSDGRYRAAVRAAETAVVQTAGTGAYAHLSALVLKTWALHHSGDPDAARETLTQAWRTYGDDYPDYLVGALALVGESAITREVLRQAETRWSEGEAVQTWSCFWATYYLDELDEAFVWLNRAIEDRQVGLLPMLRRSPLLDPIREDARYVAALARLAAIEAQDPPTHSVAYP